MSATAVVAALFAVLAFPTIVRLRLLDLPLERDEGEYAYAGQLMLQGIPPYELVYNMKFPGTYAAYAAIMAILGETVAGIRIGLLLVTTITAVLLYLLGAKHFGRAAGVIGAGVYALLALAPEALALHGHATHFIAPFVVAAMLLLEPQRPWHLFAAGALLAVAVLMKQPAIFFALFAFVYVAVLSTRRLRDLAMLVAGGATIAVITLLVLWQAGVLDRFWFWTIQYAREYGSQVLAADAFRLFRTNLVPIIGFAPALWLAAAAGLYFVIRHGSRVQRALVLGFAIAALLATMPGFYFREHYFIVLFPALALACGAAIRRQPSLVIAASAIVITIATSWSPLMTASRTALTRELYGSNPFPESIEIARYLRANTQPADRIVVLGSEPQIYFYAQRKSATGYIYAYPLMEEQPFAPRMQQEMIRQIETANPKYLVFVSVSSSWLRRPDSHLAIFDWFGQEIRGGKWMLDGVADIGEKSTEYVWGEAAQRHQPRSDSVVLIYRRAA